MPDTKYKYKFLLNWIEKCSAYFDMNEHECDRLKKGKLPKCVSMILWEKNDDEKNNNNEIKQAISICFCTCFVHTKCLHMQ